MQDFVDGENLIGAHVSKEPEDGFVSSTIVDEIPRWGGRICGGATGFCSDGTSVEKRRADWPNVLTQGGFLPPGRDLKEALGSCEYDLEPPRIHRAGDG